MPPTLHRQLVDGVPVLTIEERSLPIARYAVALRRGAGHDGNGQSGELRAMFELMLRGTKQRTREEFSDALEVMGSGAYDSVGHEAAWMRGSALTRHLGDTFAMVTEAITSPSFDEEEHRRLLAETVEELRSIPDDDPSLADHFLRRALYGDHPMARPTRGLPPDVENLTVEDLRNCHKTRWNRSDAFFMFAGDVGPDRAAQLAAPLIASLPTPPKETIDLPMPSRPDGVHIVVVDKPDRTQTQLRLGCFTGTGYDERTLAAWLGTVAFGGTFTSPLTHEVREVRGWSYDASASLDRNRRTHAPMTISSAPATSDALDCLELELELFANLARGELPDQLIDNARGFILNRYPFNVATASDMLVPAVRAELLQRPLDSLFDFPQQLASITCDAVREAVASYMDPKRVLVLMVATASEVVPALEKRFGHATIEVVGYRHGLE